jgi:hypothetical protein
MDGVLPIVFLAVILKIPVFFGIWLIWWAARAEPELEDLPGDSEDHSFRRFRRNPLGPSGPRRRGPHGGAAQAQPDCPPGGRTRIHTPPQPVALPAGHIRQHDRRDASRRVAP